jgi:hypothetical protein
MRPRRSRGVLTRCGGAPFGQELGDEVEARKFRPHPITQLLASHQDDPGRCLEEHKAHTFHQASPFAHLGGHDQATPVTHKHSVRTTHAISVPSARCRWAELSNHAPAEAATHAEGSADRFIVTVNRVLHGPAHPGRLILPVIRH